MANALFDKGREGYLSGALSWSSDNVQAMLVRGYSVSLSTHDFEDDITGASGTIVARTANLGTKSVTAGVADAADSVWSSVGASAACQYVVFEKYNATASAAALIAYIDSATGLSVTPNGGDINLIFDNGANKIFKL